jgi:hypothetical protein
MVFGESGRQSIVMHLPSLVIDPDFGGSDGRIRVELTGVTDAIDFVAYRV